MPQDVRALEWRHDAGPLHCAPHHRRDAVTSEERPTRRDRAQEHAIAATGRPAFEIAGDRIPDVLRQRQTDLGTRFARNPQRARLPLDIGETQLRNVAGPQPEARQQQHDRTITSARTGIAVTRSNQPADLLGRQIPRHVGKLPMSIGRNGAVETCLAAAHDCEVSQESTQARRHLLDRTAPGLSRTCQEVAADVVRPPAWRVRSKCRHQAGGVASVEPDGGIGCAAMLAQPRLEVGDQLRLSWGCNGGGRPTHTDLDEMPAEKPCAVDRVVIAPTSLGARTPTAAQVLAERGEINVRQACALLDHDMAEVSRSSQIAHRCLGAIALLFQRQCKPVEVRPARPSAQIPQHLRCRKVRLQHVRPRK